MKGRFLMSIIKEKFGELNGNDVHVFTLDNGKGLSAQILSLGGIIKNLFFDGVDVVFGRDSMDEYSRNNGYYGALIGRNSNRIENAEFTLNGNTYKLYANNGRNNLHGGKIGFDKKIWAAQMIDAEEPSLILTLHSPDGDEGFPGNLDVKVTYTLTEDNAISIHYEGVCDADTVLNMTNHSYFNMNGHASGSVDNHTLWIDSDFYTPNSDECMPWGEVLSVKGTPFDFTQNTKMSEHFSSDHNQVTDFDGFDHNFVLNGYGYRLSARLTGDKTGITMEMYTDCSGVQLYTCNKPYTDRVCKDGAIYGLHGAVCLETQSFPNSLKYSHFPNGILRKGQKYDTTTIYKFIKA